MRKLITLIAIAGTFLLSFGSYAQDRSVSGKVTGDDGNPLPGVNVVVKGTTTGTVTDMDGNYKFVVQEEDASLVFTFIGYVSQTVEIGNQSSINVTLETDIVGLSEVVITAFGISREKKALGYSVDQIGQSTIASSGQTNIVNALQGRVAGVTIRNSSGTPGSGADIIIRGISSLDPNRSSRPLYVIDGIEMSDDVDALPITPSAGSNAVSSRTQSSVSNRAIDINPEDIESMSILKGAQATALYGIRAANGAIIITTKKGQKGKPQINIYYSAGWDNVNKTPTIQRSYIDGNRGTTLKRTFLWDTWGAKVFDNEPNEITDVYDDFFQTGNTNSFGASVAGANETFNYRFSLDRYDQTGIIPNTEWGKTNLSLSTGVKISEKLEANVNVIYANTGGNRPHEGDKSVLSDLSYVPTVADMTKYETPYTYSNNEFAGIIDHPLFLADHNRYEDNVNRYITGLGLKYTLNENISINYKIGTDIYSDVRTRIVDPETDEGSKVHGFIVEQNSNSSSLTSNLFAQFNYRFASDISFSAIIGQYVYTSNKKWISTRGEYLGLSGYYNLNNALNIFQDNSESQYHNAAIYAESTVGYKDYLYLSVTGRNDWSSTLPKQNNSYFFPSTSLTWVVSDMLELPEFFTFAKVRASYAVVGKDASPYKIGTYYAQAENFPFGTSVGFRQSSSIGDDNLRPEFSKTFEVGTDLRFFDNKVGFEFTYYKNNLSDMILSVPVSNASGFARYVFNAGAMESHGVEIAANATPVKINDFSWNVNINWSTQEGNVIEIDESIEDIVLFSSRGITNKYVRDGKLGDLYAYRYMRAPDGQLLINSNGYPEVNWDSLQLSGNAFPDWTAGMTNTFAYKGLELGVLLEWKQGGDAFDMGRRNSMRNGQLKETERRFEEVIFNGVVEVVDGSGNVTGYTPNTTPIELGQNFYRSSTYYNYASEVLLEDASWFRIRNISLSYNFPKSMLGDNILESVRVSFVANNVFLNTPFKGYDPETNYFGSGSNIYGYTGLKTPATRSFAFKVNVGF